MAIVDSFTEVVYIVHHCTGSFQIVYIYMYMYIQQNQPLGFDGFGIGSYLTSSRQEHYFFSIPRVGLFSVKIREKISSH